MARPLDHGFGCRGARRRALSRAIQVVHSWFCRSRLDVVLGNKFRLGLEDVWIMCLQLTSNPPMNLLPLRLEQTFMRGIANERMLKGVNRFRRYAATENEFG